MNRAGWDSNQEPESSSWGWGGLWERDALGRRGWGRASAEGSGDRDLIWSNCTEVAAKQPRGGDQEEADGASLVAQWLRIRLPMQGTRVRALVWEDPTCRGATGPVSHNY